MIDSTLRLSFAHRALVMVLVAAGVVAGAVAWGDLRRDVFPDLATPVFNAIVQNSAMAAEELETAVAIPLEAALAGLPDVLRVRSVSQLGVAQVTIEFKPETDFHRARQLVAERVAAAAAKFPAGTDPPLLSSLSGRLNEIFEFTLEAEPGTVDLMTLRDFAEFEVQNRLLAVPGVAAVERLGGYLRQVQIQLDPERMSARGVSLDDVLHAAQGANLNAAGGFVVQGAIEWTIRAVGQAQSVEDLRTTAVAVRGQTPVLLGEVAAVVEAPAVRRGIAHRLRGEVVSCRVVKQFGADTVAVAAAIHQALDELRAALPAGAELRVVYDQSELVKTALGGVGRAVGLGALLVILVLFALLGNWRAAWLVTLTLPLSLALAFLLLKVAGIGLNTMTLGGLAIAVGLLVDAAIIMVENILHRLARERPEPAARPEQALAAALEVGRPITFATLIVIAVFLPLFSLSGLEGRMLAPLAAAVIAAVVAALILALTLVPALAGRWLRGRPASQRSDASSDHDDVALIRWLKARYAPLLEACLRRAGWVRVGSLALTGPVLLLGFTLGSDFMPQLDEGALLLQTLLPAEASLDEVDRRNHRVEDVLREFPEVVDVVRRTGRAEHTEDPMPHTLSDVLVVLRPERGRSPAELTAAMRERLEKVPGVAVLFTTPLGMRIDEGLGGSPADLTVKIFGPDLDQLARLADQARAVVAAVPGIADLRVEPTTSLPQLQIVVDREATARAGLTPAEVVHAIHLGLVGETLSQVRRGARQHDLVVRLDDRYRSDLNAVRTLFVDGHDGTRIPLTSLVRFASAAGPAAIRREAASRRLALEASVVDRDLGRTAAEVKSLLTRELDLPAGYFVQIGGRVEAQARATRSLLLAIGLAAVAVFALLAIALGSAAEALVILATLPDALVGGILALWLAGETWNVASLVGLIGLLGIAVQNGLVLVVQTRALVQAGQPFAQALRQASIGRLRPKLLTAATATLGLLPLLVLPLAGTEIERPLAIVMIGGLLTSTLFTLLALPTFYAWVAQLLRPAAEGPGAAKR